MSKYFISSAYLVILCYSAIHKKIACCYHRNELVVSPVNFQCIPIQKGHADSPTKSGDHG